MTSPIVAFRQSNRWRWGHSPLASLSLSLDDLPTLGEQMAKAGAQFACGVLPYDAGAALQSIGEYHQPINVHLFNDLQEGDELPNPTGTFQLTQPFSSANTKADYQAAFRRIQAYLHAGDCYQVNYARYYESGYNGDTYAGWHRLMQQHQAPHACYFQTDNTALLSASPERFLAIRNGRIITDPIKGSRPRGETPAEDKRLGESLLRSAKDRAENLMIVDLLRNDLGKICQAGSVVTAPLFELQRFSNVQHLVSRVTGQLRPGINAVDALLSCFPGGSITGAPKRRAMEIIQELETRKRHAYCGTFFVLDRDGNLDANILIRTFQLQQGNINIHGGGGITVASNCDDEFEECQFKVNKLMQALSK